MSQYRDKERVNSTAVSSLERVDRGCFSSIGPSAVCSSLGIWGLQVDGCIRWARST